jgi:hypothetical protein
MTFGKPTAFVLATSINWAKVGMLPAALINGRVIFALLAGSAMISSVQVSRSIPISRCFSIGNL